MAQNGRTRLTILGSGWGSFSLFKRLNPQKYSVTVISPRNHMLFTPLLPSASVGTFNPLSITEPMRPHCAAIGARFCEAHAERIDLEQKMVQCQTLGGESYNVSYDCLVLAVGKRANDYNVPGVRRHALFMKETADARRLRCSILQRLEEASCLLARAPEQCVDGDCGDVLRQLLSIVVVGGGPSSVDFAAELSKFIEHDLAKVYHYLRPFVSVHLVSASGSGPQVDHYDQTLREYTLSQLKQNHSVQVHQGVRIMEVTRDFMILDSGDMLPYGILVWNAGMLPVPLVKSLGVEKSGEGKVIVDECCRVVGQPDVFAIGDCAQIRERMLPLTARVASQQGAYLAEQLNSDAVARFSKPFAMKGIDAIGGKLPFSGSALSSTALFRRLAGAAAFLEWRAPARSFFGLSLRTRVALLYDRISAYAFGRPLTREGQDSLDAPTTIATWRRRDRPGGSLDPVHHEELNLLLKDIGMDGDVPEIGSLISVNGLCDDQLPASQESGQRQQPARPRGPVAAPQLDALGGEQSMFHGLHK